jgi:hypothetical protein
LQLARRFRIPAILCALAVLLCELLSRPYVNMGIADDGTYILMARTLATTGHIIYNGWAAPMLGWQLYLGTAFIKLFGFSFTAVRMSTVLVAMAMAFLLQRIMVRASITEPNATLGTLALVLSPLYLTLSVTFMTDIFGLFAIVLCLYGCMRALQASTSRAAILWLCFAVATNAVCGTSRQIGWLGLLVMVPSTLWLLRTERRVVIAGATANLFGALFIFGCLHWLKLQPYVIPDHLFSQSFSPLHVPMELGYFSLDAPFLLLPILVLFLPDLRRVRPRVLVAVSAFLLGYFFLALYPSHLRGHFPLEPVGEWTNAAATFAFPILQGSTPAFLPRAVQTLLTLATVAGLLGLVTSLRHSSSTTPPADVHNALSWKQLRILLGPFSIAYILLSTLRGAGIELHDRYLLGLLVVAILGLMRYYQEKGQAQEQAQEQRQRPLAGVLMVAVMALYSIAAVHSMFAFYRARVALASELTAAGIPNTSVDNGWEYNFDVELQHADHINDPLIERPIHGYTPTPPLPAASCAMNLWDDTPHIRPTYGVSFTPDACYGPAPFAPVHYSRWPYRTPGTLYVVRYTPSSAR